MPEVMSFKLIRGYLSSWNFSEECMRHGCLPWSFDSLWCSCVNLFGVLATDHFSSWIIILIFCRFLWSGFPLASSCTCQWRGCYKCILHHGSFKGKSQINGGWAWLWDQTVLWQTASSFQKQVLHRVRKEIAAIMEVLISWKWYFL
jgi:hypothetical protein